MWVAVGERERASYVSGGVPSHCVYVGGRMSGCPGNGWCCRSLWCGPYILVGHTSCSAVMQTVSVDNNDEL